MWRPTFTHRFRVATVVPGPEDEVAARLSGLPATTRVRTIATSAGVVVTLERVRRGPLAWRRRTIRSLQRQLSRATTGPNRADVAAPAGLSVGRPARSSGCTQRASS
jgi:hypothetical protein